MALDQEERWLICFDLASVSRYELQEVISGPISEPDKGFYVSEKELLSSRICAAEGRLEIVQKLRPAGWENDYEDIKGCIKHLKALRIDDEGEGDETP